MSESNSESAQSRYARLFQGDDAVARYQRKLGNRIDIIRDDIEARLLGVRVKGSLFDCTVGTGRLIGRLPQVTRYDGMDLSQEFVDHVKRHHPSSTIFSADLTAGVPVDPASYDNILCLRSLSGIGNLAHILPEMVRAVKPGGFVVFDYGRKPTVTRVKGELSMLDGDDLEAVLKTLDATEVERIHLDAILTRAKIYDRVFRFLTGPRGYIISDAVLRRLEEWMVPMFWQRQIVILRRHASA